MVAVAMKLGLARGPRDDRQKASAVRFSFIVLVGRPEMAKPSDQMAGGTVGRGRLLASHADREQVIDTLKAAFVQGLLTKDEFDLRVGQTLGSRTYAELAVTADIPGGPIGAQLPPKRAQVQARAAGNTAVKSGVCTLTTIILAFSTSAAAVSGPRAALIMALFLIGIGVTIAVIVALLTAGIRLLELRVSELGCSAASSANPQTIASLPPDSGQASACTSSGSKPAGDRDVTRESGAVLQAGLQGVARCSNRCCHHLMNAQPEITQRDLRMRSKEIMDAVERRISSQSDREGAGQPAAAGRYQARIARQWA